jgi:hypothetical protein
MTMTFNVSGLYAHKYRFYWTLTFVDLYHWHYSMAITLAKASTMIMYSSSKKCIYIVTVKLVKFIRAIYRMFSHVKITTKYGGNCYINRMRC